MVNAVNGCNFVVANLQENNLNLKFSLNYLKTTAMTDDVVMDIFNTGTCLGCLSANRKLTEIVDESNKFFRQLLDESFDYTSELIYLCWECVGNVQKAIRFKKRVNTAARLLREICKDGIGAHLTLSTLKIKETSRFNVGIDDLSNDDALVPVKLEYDENASTIDDSDDLYTSTINYDDVDHDTDVKLETTPTEEDVVTKTRRNTRSKKHKSIDSDDEPLKPKSKIVESDSGDNYIPERVEKQKKKKTKVVKQKKERLKESKLKKEKPGGVVNNSRVKKTLEELNVDSSKVEMVLLTWEEVEEERQKALNSVTFTRHEYRCYDCVIGFNHKFKLENHMKKHDESAGPMECGVCRVRCRGPHALSSHRRRHRLRWRCVSCGATCSRAAVAADHAARAHHAAAPTHACLTCGHTESSLGKLRIHLKNHKERQKCELCGKNFRDRNSLKTHLFIHKGEKEYGCPKCDKKFLFKKAMEVHLVTHDAPAALYCHECDKNFKNQMSYYQHMKYNLKHIDPAKLRFACQLCDKRFLKASRLEEHHVAVHLKATPIRCTMAGCTFACASRPVLRTHIRMLHRNFRAVRNHVCDTCGKAYTTKKTLEGHMRTHTGERPFHCQLCPSTFGYEAALYNHNKLVHLKTKAARRPPNPAPLHQQAELTTWNHGAA